MSFSPSYLAQLFEPPEQHQGVFGWLCGYAADASFLENALERFSCLTRAQRAYQGRIFLAVMLDPGNAQIAPAAVPGALHLPAKDAPRPFRLLHAKVAVLGFQKAGDFILRVIVSTGNWTRQTLEESLDLAWHVEVSSNDAETTAAHQSRTDLAAAWGLLSSLQEIFDLRLLDYATDNGGDTANAVAKFVEWLGQLNQPRRGYRPRIFDNRQKSFFAQLPHLVEQHAGHVGRNYLAVGSGFYEGNGAGGALVPEKIYEALRKKELVTKSCEKDIFVNPDACQAIAENPPKDWHIRAATQPKYFGTAPRSLHAKFIFSANWREDSNKCASPWIYLGSGNLTNPGFMKVAGLAGNLEAGVVFVPQSLRWAAKDRKDDGIDIVTNRLPIHRNGTCVLPALEAGEEMAEREALFVAAPVALFLWDEQDDSGRLRPQGEVTGPFDVIRPDGRPCTRDAYGNFDWPNKRPKQVTVKWFNQGDARAANVPVVDHYGRYCAADLPTLELEDAWLQLASFPMPPDDEELAESDVADAIDGVCASAAPQAGSPSTYPIRQMMSLIENIAAKQASIGEADWAMWCNRMEQVLTQAKDSVIVKTFQASRLNPLYPLFAPAFRPAFAATGRSMQGPLIETALHPLTAPSPAATLPPPGGQL